MNTLPTPPTRSRDTRPIVVGIDGTGSALAAARWAAGAASTSGVPLVLVHVASDVDPTDESGPEAKLARSLLARASSEVTRSIPGVNARTQLIRDTAAEALARLSASARLVAVGLGEAGESEEPPLGATAVALARHWGSPVVAVRRWPLPARESREVVVGVRDLTEDTPAIEIAFQEAERRGASLLVLHSDPNGHLRDRAEPALAARFTGWRRRYPQVTLRCEVHHDAAKHALLRRSGQAELVVVGQRARGTIGRAVFGSTSRWLLRHSRVPVLVVPGTGTAPAKQALPVSGAAMTMY